MQISEKQLRAMMLSGLEGDGQAHAALLSALVPILRSFYRRRVPGGGDFLDDIEDLVQETLIAVHSRRDSYDRTRPFTVWLFAIARYKLIDNLRRCRAMEPVEDLLDILVAEGFEDATLARMDLKRLLEILPAKQAKAIWDTKIDGLSVAEAANSSRISASDLKISVHRGLRTLVARIRGGQ
ncbi:MAG TPA: sigma-70 family RNA polymerase sigma factor [Steroidobacteraceae bacterium]